MKKIIKFPLSKYFIFGVFSLILGVVIFTACNKEILPSTQVDANEALNKQKILDAKMWFEKNRESILSSAVQDFKKIEPIWATAINLKKSIEMDVYFNGKSMRPFSSEKAKTNNNFGKIKILFTPDGSDYLIETLTYIPSDSSTGNIKKVNASNILEENFDGYFTFQNLKSNFFQLSEIKHGEIVQTHTASKNQDDFSSAGRVSNRSSLCSTTICVDYFGRNYDEYNGYGDWYYIDSECATSYYTCGPDSGPFGPGGDPCSFCNPDGSPTRRGVVTSKKTTVSCQCGNQTRFWDADRNQYDPDNFATLVFSYTIHLLINVFDCSIHSPNSYFVFPSEVHSVSGNAQFTNLATRYTTIKAVNEEDPKCGFYIVQQITYNTRYIKEIDDATGASVDLGKDIGKFGASVNKKNKVYDFSVGIAFLSDQIKLD